MVPIRRYSHIALVLGALAAAVAASLLFAGAFGRADSWLLDKYRAAAWIGEAEGRVLWLEAVVLVALAAAVSWWWLDFTDPAQRILVTCGALAVAPGFSLAMGINGMFFSPFAPMLGALLGAVAGVLFGATERGKRKELLERLVGGRVSQRQFDRLLESAAPPLRGSRLAPLAVLSCRIDIEGEGWRALAPEERIACADLFVRMAGDLMLSRGALVERGAPGLVQGSFGVFETGGSADGGEEAEAALLRTAAVAACETALDLRDRFRVYRQECESRWLFSPRCGAGLGAGALTVGVCTGREGEGLAAMGPEVEFSDRLAMANPRYGSELLCDPEVFRAADERFLFRPVEMLYDPLRREMTECYELVGSREACGEEGRTRRDAFWEGVVLLRGGRCEEALERFSRARAGRGDDRVLQYFVAKAQAGLVGDKEEAFGRYRLIDEEEGHARLLDRL